MALKIRLRKQGRLNRPFYRLVVADSRERRDGNYIELLGWYNPLETELEKSLSIHASRVQHWLDLGAQLTENVQNLVKKVAPEIVKKQTEKALALRAKEAAKRKARSKKATA